MGHESLIQRRPSLSHLGWLKYFFQTYNVWRQALVLVFNAEKTICGHSEIYLRLVKKTSPDHDQATKCRDTNPEYEGVDGSQATRSSDIHSRRNNVSAVES